MDRATRAALVAFLLALVGGFLFFLGYHLFVAPAETILSQFRTEWTLRRASLGLLENLVPLLVAALLVTYSIIINPESLASQATIVTSAFDNIRGPLIILTLVAMGYTAALGLLSDRLESGATRLTSLSESALTYRDEATAALRQGEVEQALRFLRLYQSIAGRNAQVAPAEDGSPVTVSALIAEVEAREPVPGIQPEGEVLEPEEEPLTAEENAQAAQEYLAQGDYVNAHYFARRALQLEPNWRAALEILTRARQNLDRPGDRVLEEEQRDNFQEKRRGLQAWQDADVQDGYRALNRGKVIEAFEIFHGLRQELPDDEDVRRYYEEARRALQNQALTLAEMTSARAFPGVENILYAGYWDGDRGLVKIGSLVPGDTASFAYDVEFLRFDAAGRVVEHVRAEAGKLIDTTLYFRLIEEDPELMRIRTTARWIVGDPPEDEPLIALDYGVEDLALFSAGADGAPTRSLAGRIRMLSQGPEAGYNDRSVATELALLFLRPFALIVLSIIAIGAGWSQRSRYLRRPLWLLIPAVVLAPFVVKVFYEFYMEAHRSIVLLLLQSLEFSTTLLVVGVVELAILFGAIFYLAREVNQGAT